MEQAPALAAHLNPQAIVDALLEAEKQTIPLLARRPRHPWITPELAQELQAAKRLRAAHDKEAIETYNTKS